MTVPQVANPYSGYYVFGFHLVRQACHVGEFLVSVLPRSVAGVLLPSVVNHHERSVFTSFGKGGDKLRIAQDLLVRAVSDGVVPVVGAVDHPVGDETVTAHLAAEQASGRIGRHCAVILHYNAAKLRFPSTEDNSVSSASCIQPKGDSAGVVLP